MQSTLTPIYVRSVPSTFSWDNADYHLDRTNIVPVISGGVPVYVGYAPITQILLDSNPINFDINNPYFVRSVNFGDYYNTKTNVLNISGLTDVKFSHTYLMPGLYSITHAEAEYQNTNSYVWNEITIIPNTNLIWTQYTGISASTIQGNTIVPNVTATINESTCNFLLSVVELMPTAYLSSNISTAPENIVFPLTVTITPRYTQTGSFPIEKIVWDLGDGSPLITRRRWDTTTSYPFVSTGALSADLADPRNFDVVYTYTQQSVDQYTFYPSITAYVSSTGSTDSCAITIGPITPQTIPNSTIVDITQADFSEDGVVLLGHVGSDTSVWKTQ